MEIYLATEDGPMLIVQTLSGDFLPEAKILQSETEIFKSAFPTW